MLNYIFLWLVICVEALFLFRPKKPLQLKLFMGLVGLELILIAGLRSINVGRDSLSYFYLFNIVSSTADIFAMPSYMERGFLIFVKGLSLIYNHPQILFITVAGLFVASSWKLIYRYSPNFLFSVLIFISAVPLGSYVFGMSFLRQAMAISIVFVSFDFLLKKSFLPFLSFVLLATLFHKSALVFVVLYPFIYIKCDFERVLLVGLGGFVLFAIFPLVISHLPSFFARYQGYAEWDVSFTSRLGAAIKAFIQLSIFVFLFSTTRKGRKPLDNILCWISFFAFLCEMFGIRFLFANRILYFTVFNTVIVPYAWAHIQSKRVKWLCLFCIFAVIWINNAEFMVRRMDREHLLQYEWVWQNPQAVPRWNLYDN